MEDRLLMTLEYLREYRTYFHLGKSYGLSESACYRNCKWIEDVLIKRKTFALPGKKALLKNNEPWEVNQLQQAALSIPLNIAEGTGEYAIDENDFIAWLNGLPRNVQEFWMCVKD